MDESAPDQHGTPARVSTLRWVGLVAGPGLAACLFALLGGSVSHEARAVAAVAAWMAVWWMTEALPLGVTSLLPLVLFPGLGVMSLGEASRGYADPLVGLFFAGFVLGLAVEKCGLHRRIALTTLTLVGTRPSRLIGGFMLASAVMSMFISNTATALLMLPIALSVIGLLDSVQDGSDPRRGNVAPSLLLSVAFACSIGGVTTLTGTQPNLILARLLLERGVEIGWVSWLPLGLVLLAVMLPAAWVLLTRVLMPVSHEPIQGVGEMLRTELRGLGRLRLAEWVVVAVFTTVAAGWITRDPLSAWLTEHGWLLGSALTALGDTGVALVGVVLLFAIPVQPSRGRFVMDWPTASRLPWEVLLLFGGGLSLAAGVQGSGLDVAIGARAQVLGGLPEWVMIGAVALVVIFLTNLTSNTAVTAAVVPVIGGAASGLGIEPLKLMVTAGVVASYAFILPVGTPPNAIVFGSGRLTIAQMAKSGLVLNLVAAAWVTLVMFTVGPWLLGVDGA